MGHGDCFLGSPYPLETYDVEIDFPAVPANAECAWSGGRGCDATQVLFESINVSSVDKAHSIVAVGLARLHISQ